MIYEATIVSTVFDVIFWAMFIGMNVAGITILTEKLKEHMNISTKRAAGILLGMMLSLGIMVFFATFVGMSIAEAYVK